MQVLKNSLLTEELQVELQKKTICSRLDEVDEVAALSKLANSSHKDLLSIPLVEAFLHIKWQLIKGQIKSECVYEIIDLPKYHRKIRQISALKGYSD